MGPVQRAVRASVSSGDELHTPGRAKPFWIDTVDSMGVVLLMGKGRHRTRIPWSALEGVPELLSGREWVKTTGTFAPDADTTTLSGYLKQYVYRETANWVAVVLEQAGVLELDRDPPIRARLRGDFR